MWHRPQLMTALSDLLFAAASAALLVAAALWCVRLPLFPLREVVFVETPREVRPTEIAEALHGRLRGNFFSVNLELVRQSLERLPWVRHAEVRRHWPGRLEVRLEEHVPVAFWGQAAGREEKETGKLVNSYGEVFSAAMSRPPTGAMPTLSGPPELAPEMIARYREALRTLEPIGRWPSTLNVSPRLAVTLRLDDGMAVELGREEAKAPLAERLRRFVDYYPSVLTAAGQRPSVVDMRYPNGFALRAATPPATDNRGKP